MGNGCFWHTQYDFFRVERDELGRGLDQVTARVGYAGGTGSGPHGQVCYHGGPAGTMYGEMDYAEAVQVMLDADADVGATQFEALVTKYFSDTFHRVGDVWVRGDPMDRGPDYRNVIGIPGGTSGALYAAVVEANVNGMELVEGTGGASDSVDEGVVYVYDSEKFPFYRGEQYHQFHANVVLRRDVPKEYLVDAARAAANRGWTAPTCADQQAPSPATTNAETLATGCGESHAGGLVMYDKGVDDDLDPAAGTAMLTIVYVAGLLFVCMGGVLLVRLGCSANETHDSHTHGRYERHPDETGDSATELTAVA